jgi:uncharacterized protein (DUF302 family)
MSARTASEPNSRLQLGSHSLEEVEGATQMTITTTRYGIGTVVPRSQAEAVDRITAALQEEGFGILTTIDIQQTLGEKLGAEIEPYVILGACNPQLAHQALEAEPEIGLLLSCNVIVYCADGKTRIGIIDPESALNLAGNPSIVPMAEQATQRLQNVV